jgi:putative holliday junction resolvase
MLADNCLPAGEQGHGRILALDLGEKRIGVALSDETRLVARSFTVIARTSRLADFEKIGRIVDEQAVTLIVVGLPLHLDGREGQKAAWARDYAAALAGHLRIPVELWDEALTTVAAQESMRQRGQSRKKQREWVDAVAAAFILQNYLDAQKNDGSIQSL